VRSIFPPPSRGQRQESAQGFWLDADRESATQWTSEAKSSKIENAFMLSLFAPKTTIFRLLPIIRHIFIVIALPLKNETSQTFRLSVT
jgi:hypothetical protein